MTIRLPRLTAILALLAAFTLVAAVHPARAEEPLVADLSLHLVPITTGFSGTHVLLFGAAEGAGDVIVVVRGPNHSQAIRRKARQAGIWVKVGSAEVDDAPSFYRVAASRPLADIAQADVLERHQIGLDHLDLVVKDTDSGASAAEYRAALLRQEQSQGLWDGKVQGIDFLDHELFHTQLDFPANVPTGTYRVEVYLLDHGHVVSAKTTPLEISEIGLGAKIFNFAHRAAPLYGVMSIMLAAATGWLAAMVLKKR